MDSNDLKKSPFRPFSEKLSTIILISFANDLNDLRIILSYNPSGRLGFSYGYCIYEAFWTVMTSKRALLGEFIQNMSTIILIPYANDLDVMLIIFS